MAQQQRNVRQDLQAMKASILDLVDDLETNFSNESRVLIFVKGKLKEAAHGFEQELRNMTIDAQEIERKVGIGKVK